MIWLQNVRTLGVMKDANWKDFFEATPNPVLEVMVPERCDRDGNEIKIDSTKEDRIQSRMVISRDVFELC